MRKIPALLLLTLFGLTGCDTGPAAPTAQELKDKFTGAYCSEDARYRLNLQADGRYVNKRRRGNPFGGQDLLESCEGNFKFLEDAGSWKLVFEKSDAKSNPMVQSCSGEVEVWNKEGGFLVGDSLIQLQDLFDGTQLSNANCGGDGA